MQQEMERRQTELSTAQGTIRYHVHRLYICFSRVSQDGPGVVSTFSPQETRGAVEGDAGGEGRAGGSTAGAARDDDQVCQLAVNILIPGGQHIILWSKRQVLKREKVLNRLLIPRLEESKTMEAEERARLEEEINSKRSEVRYSRRSSWSFSRYSSSG